MSKQPIKIQEGNTSIFVYIQKTEGKGPGTKTRYPFYNPTMEINRDSSLLIAQWLIDSFDKPIRFLDGLAASGIRGLRFANELKGECVVNINDWNDKAYSLIQKNISYNKLENTIASKQNLHSVLSENRFEYIDIDPFGSPIEYIDGSMRSIVHQGVIACTATDTAVLCGVYPKVCLRRYAARPLHGFLMQEIGIRILLGVLCREAAKYDKGINPLWSYVSDHFFRLYVQILNGKKFVNNSMKHYKILNSKTMPLSALFTDQSVGPVWDGELHKSSVLEHMQHSLLHMKLGTKGKLFSSLNNCLEETGVPPFFYSTEAAAHLYKMSPLKLKLIIDRLQKSGYKATHCSFSSNGFRTNAPNLIVEKMLQD
jgi:tRNA (guanine26-N2/guanine27-N2)-dimethyltransferase